MKVWSLSKIIKISIACNKVPTRIDPFLFLSLLYLFYREATKISLENGDWIHLIPSKQSLGALLFEFLGCLQSWNCWRESLGILWLPLEFELLERIFRILWLLLRVKEGGKYSYNFSLLSPTSLDDKILIKILIIHDFMHSTSY